MQHIFLTGSRQVGKSTAIQKALDAAAPVLGGFRSLAGVRDAEGDYIHLVHADGTEALAPENRAFHRGFSGEKRRFQLYPQVFENHGVALLQPQSHWQLILMDELGILEANCEQFHAAVLRTLDGTIPVLGVVQEREGGFLDEIRKHPNVRLIYVTEENRDQVAQELIKTLRHLVK